MSAKRLRRDEAHAGLPAEDMPPFVDAYRRQLKICAICACLFAGFVAVNGRQGTFSFERESATCRVSGKFVNTVTTCPRRTRMAEVSYEGKTFEVDEDGFLLRFDDWCPEWLDYVKESEGIAELSDDHKKVIDFLQDYYKKNGIAPMVRIMTKNTGYKLKDIELFGAKKIQSATPKSKSRKNSKNKNSKEETKQTQRRVGGVSHDLNIRCDFSYRMQSALNRNIATATTTATSGSTAYKLAMTADYTFSRLLTLSGYLDWQKNVPLVSASAYPTITADFGFSMKFSLTR